MKVFFSNPPWWVGIGDNGQWTAGVRAGSRWPFTMPVRSSPDLRVFGDYAPSPLFMMHAASYVRINVPEAEVSFRDSIALRESRESFLNYLFRTGPDVLVMESATPSWDHDAGFLWAVSACPGSRNLKVIVTGPIATARGEQILAEHPNVIACIKGEYEKGVVRVLRGERGVIEHDLLTTEEMNAAPPPWLDATHAHLYCDANPQGQRWPHLQAWTSRGCPYKCLAGDTLVDTVHGRKPIKDLVGQEFGIFTYDRIEKRAKVCTAVFVRQYGWQQLVRVYLDDGTHIDCTPDHRFLAFKWGNQHTEEREWEIQAKNLEPGTRLRAKKEYLSGPKKNYVDVFWARRRREKKHRLVAEWMMGRPLREDEQVHHRDRDPGNNDPSNLQVVAGQVEHFAEHPEIAERMRADNPTSNGVSEEWRRNLSRAAKGKPKSEATKAKMRLAAMKREANKTPEERKARAAKTIRTRRERGDVLGNPNHGASGKFVGNHKVVRVEELPGLHPVYCLTVPETGWFYANDLLVANCVFCVWPAAMTGNDPDGHGKRSVRYYGYDYLRSYLTEAIGRYGYKSVYFDDDTMNLSDRHVNSVCSAVIDASHATGYPDCIPWSAMCRADTIKPETWRMMRECGCFGVKIGFESGSQYVLDNIVNKRLDLKESIQTLHLLKTLGMTCHTTWTIGLPGETDAQRQETLDLIADLYRQGLHTSHQLSGTAEIEGTPLHTLNASGKALDRYPGANPEGFDRTSDGMLKLGRMVRP